MDHDGIISRLESLHSPENAAGMHRYGITPAKTYGVRVPDLRRLAKEVGRSHELALQLWQTDTRETRILASMIDVPEQVSEAQMEAWVSAFDYWEICDQCCMNLFEKSPFAYAKAVEWSGREAEFVKRAGFVMMARLAVSDKQADDDRFVPFLSIIAREAGDGRNFVKKAVNWALRQIGKRSLNLNQLAAEKAELILQQPSKSAKWIANDALKELKSQAVQTRLERRVEHRS
jgi:3-methyladenine DNA glycosylase AlkD